MTGTSTTTGMRLALTVCAGFLAAACGSSPTSPNAIPTATGPAFAGSPASDGATRLNFSVDLTVPAYPVCALTPVGAGTLHGEGVLTVVLRSVTDPNGGTRIGSSIHGHGTATDATGARWIWSDADLNNELFASGNTSPNSFSQTVHEGFHVIGPKGQKIMVIGACGPPASPRPPLETGS